MRDLMMTLALATGLYGQVVEEFTPPRAGRCLAGAAPGGVVFLGHSIADSRKLEQYFPGKPYVNRGISGQTTAQMLVRMMPNVIRLRPAAMILLAGTNDIAPKAGAEYMDSYSALVDDKGMLRAEASGDGLHPNAAGYAVMAPLAEAGIRATLRR
jgi:lysophospholipase L1-like esterase